MDKTRQVSLYRPKTCQVCQELIVHSISNMKKLIPYALVWLVMAASCQKLIDKKKEQIVLDIMTSGEWYVEQYFENTTDITGDFLNYQFRFKGDRTVTGARGAELYDGTWTENVSTVSITAQFPTAPDPVKKLNGTWKIKDSAPDFVKAELATPAGKNMLRLRKKE